MKLSAYIRQELGLKPLPKDADLLVAKSIKHLTQDGEITVPEMTCLFSDLVNEFSSFPLLEQVDQARAYRTALLALMSEKVLGNTITSVFNSLDRSVKTLPNMEVGIEQQVKNVLDALYRRLNISEDAEVQKEAVIRGQKPLAPREFFNLALQEGLKGASRTLGLVLTAFQTFTEQSFENFKQLAIKASSFHREILDLPNPLGSSVHDILGLHEDDFKPDLSYFTDLIPDSQIAFSINDDNRKRIITQLHEKLDRISRRTGMPIRDQIEKFKTITSFGCPAKYATVSLPGLKSERVRKIEMTDLLYWLCVNLFSLSKFQKRVFN